LNFHPESNIIPAAKLSLIGASPASLLYHLLCKASQLKFNKILGLLFNNKVRTSNFGKSKFSSILPHPNLSIIDFFVIL
jgi:hypothetical protein